MGSGNAEKTLCLNNKKGKKVKKKCNHVDSATLVCPDSTMGNSFVTNASLETETHSKVGNDCSSKADLERTESNAKLGHSEKQKERQSRRRSRRLIDAKGNNPTEMVSSIEGDSCLEKNVVNTEPELQRVQCILSNISLETDTCSKVGNDCSSKMDRERSQSNVKLGQSETQKGRKKRRRRRMKNAHIGSEGNNPTERISSTEGDSCLEKNGDVNSEPELQRAHCISSNASLEIDTHLEVGNICSSMADLERTQSNANLGQLLTLKERKKRRKMIMNAHIDAEGNNSEEMSSSIEGDSGPGTTVGLNSEAELPRVQFSELNFSTALDTSENSKRSNELNDYELKGNKLETAEVVQDAALTEVVENLSVKKTSACCSNGDSPTEEGNKSVEIKTDNHLDVLVKDNKDAQVLQLPLEPLTVCVKKKLLILDVNGLLADIVAYAPDCYKADIVVSKKSVFKRPFCDDFLRFCFEKFNVGIWSSRTKRNVNLLTDFLLGDSKSNLLFCWDQSHCTDTGFTTVENRCKPLVLKELQKLWEKCDPFLPWNKGDYNESNTLLLDDSPYKALRNPAHTGVFPHSYRYQEIRDSSLGPTGDLRMYLERLAEAPNVPDYVAQNPYGQRAITERNPSWSFYQRIIK